jgi:RNA polymerase sigma factor (sigma-70 family)
MITHAEAVANHSALVHYLARRYANRGVDLEDLVQEGFLALFRAADLWRPDGGAAFGSYAYRWVAARIARAFRRARRAGFSGAPEVTIPAPSSMDAVGDDGDSLHDSLGGVSEDPDARSDSRKIIRAVTSHISERDLTIVECLSEELLPGEIGERLGVSRQAVEQRIAKVRTIARRVAA